MPWPCVVATAALWAILLLLTIGAFRIGALSDQALERSKRMSKGETP